MTTMMTAWKSKESFLQITSSSIPTGGCTSIVSLRTRIVKKGRLRFTYQYILPDDFANSVLFSFHHKNYDDSLDSTYAEDSQASSIDDGVDDMDGEWGSSSLFEGDSYHINFPKATRNGKWNVFELQLPRPGYYSFLWRGITIGNIRPSTFMLEKRSLKMTDAYPSSLLDFQRHEEKREISNDPSISFQDDSLDSRVGAISIKLIELDGIAYASECTPCPAGFYSATDGSSECIPCPSDTFSSSKGSTSCQRCDEATEYAPTGSTSCHSKPVCSSVDHYEEKTTCDSNTNTQVIKYKWVEPKICREESNTVSILPPDKTVSCDFSKPDPAATQVCSPGMELNPRTGKCSFCPENEFNDGKSASCFKCPPNSLPKYSLILNTWKHEMDDDTTSLFLSGQCVLPLKDSMECDPTVIPWKMIPATTSYLRSATNAEADALLILTMSTPGFRHSSGGVFSASFELVGSDSSLVLYESLEMSFNPETMKRIGAWSGDTDAGVRKFRLTIPSNRSVSFIWLFKRDRRISSHLKIYSLELTNSLVGGAISCSLCQPNELQSQGNDDNSCIPCPSGLYLSNGDEDENDNDTTTAIYSPMVTHLHTSQMNSKCLKCPPNTVINGTLRFPRGRNASCLTCGPGLVSNDERTQCVPQCKLPIGEDIFDLDILPRPLLYRGRRLFTSQGTPHYHVFNISLCGEGVSCSNNATMEVALSSFRLHHREPKTMACRSTIIPDGGKLYATQSISLGDELIAITKETSFQGIHVHPEFAGVKSDLHFFFRSPSTTAACSEGRTLTLTLRCSLDTKDPVLSSPSNCSDVTCDGCNFHLLLRSNSSAACRKCQREEFEELVGECVSGSQVIHAINPKDCILTPSLTKRSKPCSVVPKSIQYLIMMLCLIGFSMSYTLVYFWRQNRKLVYKYSKLIEDKNPAECCIDDDEDGQRHDDDDEPENKECPNGASSSSSTNIRQQRRQERVKFRDAKHEAVDFGYETIQLTKACGDDIL